MLLVGGGDIQFPRAVVAMIPVIPVPSRKQQGPSILAGFSGATWMGTPAAKPSFGPLVFQAYFPSLTHISVMNYSPFKKFYSAKISQVVSVVGYQNASPGQAFWIPF